MNKSTILKAVFRTVLVSGTILTTFPAMAGEDVASIVKDGKFFGEFRYRYETVDQDGIANDANASTVRTNIGFKTGKYKDFQALIETQVVHNIGADDFNDTVNGKTDHPVVADPNITSINELWATYSGLPDTVIKVGRQKVNLDNQRFVGTVGWRQNDQTFDAAAIINNTIPNLSLMYAYVGNVNRIQGGKHPLGDLDTDTHILHAKYDFAKWLDITAYGYWLDINRVPSLSSKTYGLRLTGDTPINEDWKFFYEAEAALQYDHGNNTANYDEKYFHISPGVSGYGWTLQAGYEKLGGDGTNSFQTPLATGHKFNGWADKFLSTPAAGLEDAYAKIAYKVSGTNTLADGTKLTAVYHDFKGDSSGDFGSEIDLAVGKKFTLPDAGQPFKDVNVLVKYANYNADDASFTDTDKVWLQIGVKF